MDSEKIKTFLVQHFEKMILGVIVVVAGFLIYKGTTWPNFLAEETEPDTLISQANTVKLAIDEDHSENIIPDREVKEDIIGRTKQLYQPVDSTTYKLSKIWIGETGTDSIVRRQDQPS